MLASASNDADAVQVEVGAIDPPGRNPSTKNWRREGAPATDTASTQRRQLPSMPDVCLSRCF